MCRSLLVNTTILSDAKNVSETTTLTLYCKNGNKKD